MTKAGCATDVGWCGSDRRALADFWAGLLARSFLVSLAGDSWKDPGFPVQFVWDYLLPLLLLAGLELPASRWYPKPRLDIG
jgi:hypothetical protein